VEQVEPGSTSLTTIFVQLAPHCRVTTNHQYLLRIRFLYNFKLLPALKSCLKHMPGFI